MYVKIEDDGYTVSSTPFDGGVNIDCKPEFVPNIKIINNKPFIDNNKISGLSYNQLLMLESEVPHENDVEYTTIKNQKYNEFLKNNTRGIIRHKKDIEDDFADAKQIMQWMLYGILDLYSVTTPEQKSLLKYDSKFNTFAQMLSDPDVKLRVDVEIDQMSKFTNILHDEVDFANIVKSEYLDKKVV